MSASTSLPSSRSTGWISRTRCFAVSSRSSNKSSTASARLDLPTSFGPATIVTPVGANATSRSATPR